MGQEGDVDLEDDKKIWWDSVSTEQKIAIMIKQIHLLFNKSLNSRMSEYNITAAQANILVYLKCSGSREVNPMDIEKRFKLSKPTVTGLLKRLCEKGFIEVTKSERDRRHKQVILSEKGEKYLKTTGEELDYMDSMLCRGFSEEKLEEIAENLKKMLENLDN